MEFGIDFSQFRLVEILKVDHDLKTIALLGDIQGQEGQALVFLKKTGFGTDTDFQNIFNNLDLCELAVKNDIFHKLMIATNDKAINSIDCVVTFPVDEATVKKYSKCHYKLIQETPEMYERIIKPFINEIPEKSFNWIYNILDNGAESDRTIYKNKNPEIGLTVVLDLQTDISLKENFHCLGIIERRDLNTIRDLTSAHIPLLNEILGNAVEAVAKYLEFPRDEIRCYFHYHPSFYHLHVHFSHSSHGTLSVSTERAHLVSKVLSNLEICPDYYKRVTLEFPCKSSIALYSYIQDRLPLKDSQQ